MVYGINYTDLLCYVLDRLCVNFSDKFNLNVDDRIIEFMLAKKQSIYLL